MEIGFAVADITPELGIYLTGYGRPERLATGVHSPLKATVMVLQDEEKTAAVLGFDWCYMDTEKELQYFMELRTDAVMDKLPDGYLQYFYPDK